MTEPYGLYQKWDVADFQNAYVSAAKHVLHTQNLLAICATAVFLDETKHLGSPETGIKNPAKKADIFLTCNVKRVDGTLEQTVRVKIEHTQISILANDKNMMDFVWKSIYSRLKENLRREIPDYRKANLEPDPRLYVKIKDPIKNPESWMMDKCNTETELTSFLVSGKIKVHVRLTTVAKHAVEYYQVIGGNDFLQNKKNINNGTSTGNVTNWNPRVVSLPRKITRTAGVSWANVLRRMRRLCGRIDEDINTVVMSVHKSSEHSLQAYCVIYGPEKDPLKCVNYRLTTSVQPNLEWEAQHKARQEEYFKHREENYLQIMKLVEDKANSILDSHNLKGGIGKGNHTEIRNIVDEKVAFFWKTFLETRVTKIINQQWDSVWSKHLHSTIETSIKTIFEKTYKESNKDVQETNLLQLTNPEGKDDEPEQALAGKDQKNWQTVSNQKSRSQSKKPKEQTNKGHNGSPNYASQNLFNVLQAEGSAQAYSGVGPELSMAVLLKGLPGPLRPAPAGGQAQLASALDQHLKMASRCFSMLEAPCA